MVRASCSSYRIVRRDNSIPRRFCSQASEIVARASEADATQSARVPKGDARYDEDVSNEWKDDPTSVAREAARRVSYFSQQKPQHAQHALKGRTPMSRKSRQITFSSKSLEKQMNATLQQLRYCHTRRAVESMLTKGKGASAR